MVSSGAIAAAAVAARRRREEEARRRRRREEEQRRQRAAAERKRKKEEEDRRRRREEETRRKHREEETRKKRLMEENRRKQSKEEARKKNEVITRSYPGKITNRNIYDYMYQQKESSLPNETFLSSAYDFTDVLRIERKDLPIVHSGALESVLADGSRLSSIDGRYTLTYPNGKVQEYQSDYYHRSLYLTREELPNGAMVVYNTNGKKLYERDEEGNYIYHKTDSNGDIIETIEGKISSEPAKEFTDVLSIERKDLPIVHSGALESVLADGSRLSSMDGRYTLTYPNGKVQEYQSDYYHRSLYLTREELPNGAMVVYNTNGKKLYERDEQGNYTYHKTDSNGDIIETIEGKISSEPAKEFTSELSVKYEDLPIVHRGAFESVLADGSRLSSMDGSYTLTYPNGKVQEYDGRYYSGYNRTLILTREELPNGAMVVYNTNGKKLYERDEQGNYTYHKTDSNGKVIETVEQKDNICKNIIYDKNGETPYYILNGDLQKKYYLSGKLYERTNEKGEVFKFAENGVCIYEQNEKGEYAKYQLTSDENDRLLVEKGAENTPAEQYSYYPSGKLQEVKKGKNLSEVRRFTERGVCIYEANGNGQRRRFNENGVCLYENYGNGYSVTYQLAPNGKDRLLVEKEENYRTVENHSYYDSGKIKESKYADGTYVKYNEDGTYQKFDKHARLKEETDLLGKTTYTHYGETNQVEHLTRYDVKGNKVETEYKHFDKKGKEDTAYYLAMKRIVARKIEKADEKQAKKGVPLQERKVSKKMSKPAKLLAHLKAKRESRNG